MNLRLDDDDLLPQPIHEIVRGMLERYESITLEDVDDWDDTVVDSGDTQSMRSVPSML